MAQIRASNIQRVTPQKKLAFYPRDLYLKGFLMLQHSQKIPPESAKVSQEQHELKEPQREAARQEGASHPAALGARHSQSHQPP